MATLKRIKNSGIMNLEELISQDEKGRIRGWGLIIKRREAQKCRQYVTQFI